MIGTWRTKISDNLYYPYTYSSDVSLPGYHRGARFYVEVRPVPQMLGTLISGEKVSFHPQWHR